MLSFPTIDAAFLGMLSRLLAEGDTVDSRNGLTIELSTQVLTIEQPNKRFLHTRGRNNNPFAAIAETMWVLAGRNDLTYLTPYLKRAPDYSDDDGITWRAGYGPRLRNWAGVDQIAQAHSLLNASPASRRAVISLFDPALDYQDSADIPCNNWLHLLVRGGRLHINVVARSTDIWFGFSGINAFEWTVLLEMMARWLHLEVGTLTFFTSSLHLYADQKGRAKNLLDHAGSTSSYIGRSTFRYDTEWADAATTHQQWMDIEQLLRTGTNLEDVTIPFQDPMLVAYLRAIDIFWAFKRGVVPHDLAPRLALLGDSDLAFVAREFVNRPRAQNH
jgi:thymidylate synthase